MRRGLTGTILWTLLAVSVGVVLFVVKYEVKDLEHRLAGLNAEIHRNQETIHILRAEWSYLNDPVRLRTLSEKHLGMKPVTPTQVATLDTLPKDGIPATGVVYAAVSPAKMSLPPAAAQAKPSDPKAQPPATSVKLAESPARPRPAETAKPQPGKPQPNKPGTGTLAQAPIVKPLAPPVTAPAPAPAKGSRSIVIPSPALAQGEGGAR
ncbi:Putative Periplasmic protein TonB [Magnetospirillum sp. XM-1]|uniref:cell division protein FtsL n=1 Tax=Magnetospirillum sp. XM-1 TaxID=1663591 RepID=UPI00073DB75C|nr:energy transducer TonB [Magnetospirillum sp. XM-1]CUW38587.1 Putative Periplasmic protein TonB [Magnetospirillum sp. XM-1]